MSEPKLSPAIRLRGVRHNNLKNFDLDLPLHRLIVVTGLSGSGKSSLAFDTLYAEGQRRYIETFSPYARQFFDRMDKPQVDSVEGIPPAIAIEQRNAVRTTRSTVGTMTEICDYMKVLWPHIAQLHCRQCAQPVRKDSPQDVWEAAVAAEVTRRKDSTEPLSKHPPPYVGGYGGKEVLVTFDVPLSEKLSFSESLALISKQGYQRLLLNSEVVRLDEAASRNTHPPVLRSGATSHATLLPLLTVIQDRIRLALATRPRFIEACEQAYHFGKGRLTIHELDPTQHATRNTHRFSNKLHCAKCDIEYREPTPALFSFNHPVGACPKCKGFGRVITIDYDLAIPDRSLTLSQGAVRPWRTGFSAECQSDLKKFCKIRRVPMDVPFAKLSAEQQRWIIEGEKDYGIDEEHEWPRAWYGIRGYFKWLETRSYKMHVRVLLSRYRAYTTCPDCHGTRFQPDALLYLLPVAASRQSAANQAGSKVPALCRDAATKLTLADFYALSVRDAITVIDEVAGTRNTQHATRRHPTDPINHALNEIRARLAYLNEVGLGYLTLDRPTRTLSGGETERVNLTTCLGTRLVNTLFVLDEPSVGLHPRDTGRLVHILEKLRDTGNTVVVVEHEASVMRAADQIVDLGPGHGATGGEVVFQGPFDQILKSESSLTGQYLSGHKQIEIPARRPVAADVRRRILSDLHAEDRLLTSAATLRITGATRHNLKNLTVEIPLNRFVCITGVSGSGKSTLIREVLFPALAEKLNHEGETVKAFDRIEVESDKEGEEDSSRNTQYATRLTGHEHISRVVFVDQSALGKTPRSNPAVYIGAFDDIREVFAQSEPAKQRGFNASSFSFNSAQGQCERCRGAGFEKIEMQFLSDIFIRCPDCDGRRYRPHILEVRIRNPKSEIRNEWSIADMLDATVDEAIDFLSSFIESRHAQRAVAGLKLLQEVGLGYLRLGQPINTLSGGESQRLKLVSHLAEATTSFVGDDVRSLKPITGNELKHTEANQRLVTSSPTLFLFDEPTTGLHFDDVRVLLKVFQRLVDAGHSVIVVEHNLDVIKCADWVIDLGPEAGDGGGQIVAQGTPEEVVKCEASHTGMFLRDWVGTRSTASHISKKTIRDAVERVLTKRGDAIAVTGAREHNLKNLSLEIPRDKFVVVTGVSGSGKSTLAFDLLFAEGQRRFLDSMNLYARQFVEQLSRPDVDLITGLPPTVSIEQRTSRGGGKSTVATVTEIFHFMRLLFAKLGTQYCPDCQLPVQAQTRDELGRHLQGELKKRGDLLLLAPIVKGRKGFHSDVADWAAKHGYKEIRADGKMYDTGKPFRLDRFREHNVEIVIGVVAADVRRRKITTRTKSASSRRRLHEMVDETLKLGSGTLFALDNHSKLTIHSTERSCPKCSRSFEPLDPKQFSYNSPSGWCPKCRGFGEIFYMPEDVDRGAREDAIAESWFDWMEGQREICPECNGARLNPVARAVRLPLPVAATRQSAAIFSKGNQRRSSEPPLHPAIDDFSQLSVTNGFELFRRLKFKGRSAEIARDILPEIRERLRFLCEVGLGYIQLGRGVPTLSGGESQRIRLAAQLGSNLSGVLYVLDEPTIGLHARDNEQLLSVLQKLRARGNSVVVVEHDEETMRRADHIIDLGPGAGVHGGQVVASGTLKELSKHPESITGQCLREERKFPSRGKRRLVVAADVSRRQIKRKKVSRALTSAATNESGWLTLHNAAANNLKNLTLNFPLGRLVLVTGVSGSGKSTLVRECLLPALQNAVKVGRASPRAGTLGANAGSRGRSPRLSGFESLKAVYEVDQSPIGRTPRSIPATYVGFFDDIRALFAQLPEARMRGYTASRFSFNSAQGRCPQCDGAGQIKLEMNFLPPAFVRCETCDGTRFNRETLDIEYGGKNIAQILDLSVEDALEFFSGIPRIKRALEALHDTGLDYLKLGQQSPTLSGGEAQRVKLVTHLLTGLKEAKQIPPQLDATEKSLTRPDGHPLPSDGRENKHNLFTLEEPTIGLHIADVRRLVAVLQRLVDAGHSVIVIEHNLDLIAEADWVIDLGPEGGDGGGRIVAEGTPEQIARNKRSHTGRFLRKLL